MDLVTPCFHHPLQSFLLKEARSNVNIIRLHFQKVYLSICSGTFHIQAYQAIGSEFKVNKSVSIHPPFPTAFSEGTLKTVPCHCH